MADASPLTPAELRRYHRHLTLPDFGGEAQQRLKAARVLVVGLGGLGSPVAIYLAAAGVGTIGLVDFDAVDETNLPRQVIHATPDIGASKLVSASAKIAALNPHLAVELHDEPFGVANARRLVEACDVVVDGTDNFPTRYLVNDACVMAGKPNVYGSVSQFDGQASVFSTPTGPCYRCLHPEPPPAGLIPSCAEGGVLGVLPGVIGLIQATEAIKLVTGIGEPLIGRLLLYDALKMRFREITLPRDPACPVCGTHPTIRELVAYDQACEGPGTGGRQDEEAPAARASSRGPQGGSRVGVAVASPRALERERAAALSPERSGWGPSAVENVGPGEHEISVEQLRHWRSEGRAHTLVDVREPSEYAICHIEGSLFIPLGQLQSRLGILPVDRPIVVHCRSGRRSASATAMLRAKGYDAHNLVGGILAWAARIDPGLHRY